MEFNLRIIPCRSSTKNTYDPDGLRRNSLGASTLQRAPLDWFERQEYSQVNTKRFFNYLEKQAKYSTENMESIANELHVTTRTLRRKLTEQGTSFQQLKDGLRRDNAIHLLSHPYISIYGIPTY